MTARLDTARDMVDTWNRMARNRVVARFAERVDDFDVDGRHVEPPVVGVPSIGPDGLVTEWLEYYDRASMMRGMGLPEDYSDS